MSEIKYRPYFSFDPSHAGLIYLNCVLSLSLPQPVTLSG